MKIKSKITEDLKRAMLAADRPLVTTLRGLKSAVLYAEVESGKRDEGLLESEMIALLRKEAKKRRDSIALYEQAGATERAASERAELTVIESYLPAPLTDAELDVFIEQAINELSDSSPALMGKVIGRVKELTAGSVDGGRLAQAVKTKLAGL